MNCIVTAGPTYEPLDQVRRLTNFSTGRLGSELATHLTRAGHRVTLLLGQQATWHGATAVAETIPFTTTDHLAARLTQLAGESVQAVFHAAAVSDFTFGPIWERPPDGPLRRVEAGKISTRAEGRLLAELVPTPKIIARLRPLFPDAWLVGWKYEVDGERSGVIAKARQQIVENKTSSCVVNGPAYGNGFGLVPNQGDEVHCPDRDALFDSLIAQLPS